MEQLNTIEDKKIRLKELLKEFRVCEVESEREEELYIEINAILTPIVELIITNGISDFYLPKNIEKLKPQDLIMPHNEYNAVFIEDIAISFKNGVYNGMPEENFIRIMDLFEYMIDNNIRSYILY